MHCLKLFRRGLHLLGFLAAGGGSLLAQGGPPMITDDPGTPGDGHWELNVALTTERRAGDRLSELPLFDLNYGIGDRLQLKYEAALLHQAGGPGAQTGLSNSLAGIKWRFYDAGENGWQASIYPQLEFNTPGSHSDERGLAEEGTSLILPFQIMKELGSLGFNADLGLVRHRHTTAWFGGVALGRQVAPKLELAAELHLEAEPRLHPTALIANLGLRFGLTSHLSLLASVGREVHHSTGPGATLLAYFGLQIRR